MMITRTIPSSGEQLPVIGMGTWQTFDVAPSDPAPGLLQVLSTFYAGGGRVIDSSPMYGKAEEAVGRLTSASGRQDEFFYATKVWTSGQREGERQIEASFRLLQCPVIDLLQVHNLLDWKTQLPTLQRLRAEGRVRYIGITHYTDSSHAALEEVMRRVSLDFVQFNYSIDAQHAAKRLLPAAADLGVATLVNRPLGEGSLFKKVRGKVLPEWAAANGISNWASFFLKFIIAHSAVTSVIPATSDAAHMADNLMAGEGPLPDERLLRRMSDYVSAL